MQQEIGKLLLLRADVQAIVLRRQTTQTWENEAWANSTRTTFDYNGELQSQILYEDWEGGSWQNSARTIMTYEGQFPSTRTHEIWNGSAWEPDFRILSTYTGGALSEMTFQNYEGGSWVNDERTTVNLSNGVIASSQTDTWDGQTWVPAEMYTVDQDGSDVVAVTQEWNGSAWVNLDRTVYAGITVEELYDQLMEWTAGSEASLGLASLLYFPDSIVQEWDGTQWVNVSRQQSERDPNNRPLQVTMSSWDDNQWIDDVRYVATYDDGGRLSQIEWQTFDEQWTAFITETHFYDAAGLLERTVDQFDFGFGLQFGTQILFEWTNTTTASEKDELPDGIFLQPLYPNPFNPSATIRFRLASPEHTSIRVFDAAGRHVVTLLEGMQPSGDHSLTFDATGMASGVYIIRMDTPSQSQVRTVTLLR